MPRIPTFVVLGPFLAWLISIAFLVAIAYSKPLFEHASYWPSSIIFSYVFSVLPMLLAAWIDHKLSARWWRSVVCFAAGFGAALVLYYQFMHEGPLGQEHAKLFRGSWFYVGLVWGLPAAGCSWLVAGAKAASRSCRSGASLNLSSSRRD
jgi:hypothetical protein